SPWVEGPAAQYCITAHFHVHSQGEWFILFLLQILNTFDVCGSIPCAGLTQISGVCVCVCARGVSGLRSGRRGLSPVCVCGNASMHVCIGLCLGVGMGGGQCWS